MPSRKFDKNAIAAIGRSLSKLVTDRMDKVAIQTHNILTDVTPKDTGQAARGWNFTLNTIDTSIPKRPTDGTRLQPKTSVPDAYAKKITDKYHLTNAVEHIIYLNRDGHSQKTPAQFVERAVIEGRKLK